MVSVLAPLLSSLKNLVQRMATMTNKPKKLSKRIL
ncbi:hypothetical protein OESDEN_19347 [Oesophagostomum dentatum]|uniref:Uncharacterized protein n=1 Tax=Oesophagostomum dentatum TaxID=61180 RepID=A0A0B1SBP5_OESDE|nr:hypothetical protein OESDEN_19347 [Oesophagostomum dentatum]